MKSNASKVVETFDACDHLLDDHSNGRRPEHSCSYAAVFVVAVNAFTEDGLTAILPAARDIGRPRITKSFFSAPPPMFGTGSKEVFCTHLEVVWAVLIVLLVFAEALVAAFPGLPLLR